MNVVENKYNCNLPLLFLLKIILGTTHERNRCENVIRDVYPYNTCTGKGHIVTNDIEKWNREQNHMFFKPRVGNANAQTTSEHSS